MSLPQEIKTLIKGELEASPEILRRYSADASAFRIMPEVVVFPKDKSDIKSLVDFAKSRQLSLQRSISLTVRSAGSDMTGGPLNESVIIDIIRHLNKIKEIGKDYAICEPGVFYRDLEKQTLKKGLIFPSFPASKALASVGGIVANNAGGEKSLRYGKTEKYVRALKVVLRDGKEYEFKKLDQKALKAKLALNTFEGEIYRKIYELLEKNYEAIQKAKPKVSKNSTGYLLWNIWDKQKHTFDLGQIFVGSQGTLGIITEITLGLVPIEKYSQMLVVYLYNLDKLAEIINTILNFEPTALESYDDKTLRLALKFAPQLARLISRTQNLVSFGLEMLPDFWIIAKSGGLPKLVLMAEFSGNDNQELNEKVASLQKALRSFKVKMRWSRSQKQSEKYWTIRRQSFSLLRTKIKDRQTVPFIDDIIVEPEKMPRFLPLLNEILAHYPQLTYTIAGHAGNGNFHIIPLMDLTDEKQRALIPEISQKVYDLVLKFGGSLSAEHNDGLIRGPYLKQMYGVQVFELFKKVKQIFDPRNIFNPHKKTDADLKYALAHLKKDNEHEV
jgi:FAD/FMN-containing dehydrogenase